MSARDPIILTRGTDARTGVYVEEHVRNGFLPVGALPTFWCAYGEDRSPFRIATGDTKAEAIGKLLARAPAEARYAA